LISDTSKILTEAVYNSGKNVQGVKAAQMMFSARNEKVNETTKMLARTEKNRKINCTKSFQNQKHKQRNTENMRLSKLAKR